MKNLLFILLVGGMLACEKIEYPYTAVPKGYIDAMVNNNIKWPDVGNVTTVTFRYDNEKNHYPCVRDKGVTVHISAYDNPQGYGRMTTYFYLQAIMGEIQIKESFKFVQYDCSKYPAVDEISHSIPGGDAGDGRYELDHSKKNTITLTSIGGDRIEGSFHLYYVKTTGSNASYLPETKEIFCKRFVAELEK